MNNLKFDFRIFKGCCHGNQLSFSEILFFHSNSKTMPDRHMVWGKENIGNFILHRMAPSVMTSGDPESKNCFRFVLLLLKKYTTDFCRFLLQLVGLPALMIAAKLGCCPSRDIATGTNFCHFRTFSVRSGRYFVILSLRSICFIVVDML